MTSWRLNARGLHKHYGATRALAGLDMDLRGGTIIGLAGPNGAGKSTLIRLLAGEERPDQGEVLLHGPDGGTIREVWRHVAVVHQEPQVWPNMTVRENLLVGMEGGSLAHSLRRPPAVLDRLGIAEYADFQLADLSLAVGQRVEIARALLRQAEVFLFDEPNSALTEAESTALFETMRALANEGKVVLLITHRLADFERCCQRVLVLRDGIVHADLDGAGLSQVAIARQLTDDRLSDSRIVARAAARSTVASASPLRLRGWTDAARCFRDIDLDLLPGRVTAFVGVEGSGARELLQALGGQRRVGIGAARPSLQARAPGGLRVSYLAASRASTVFHNMSVGENLVARQGWAALSRPLPWRSPQLAAELARAAVQRYRVKAGGIAHPIGSLSGGNQQKVVLGAAMEIEAEVLVVEEPTRGVDIASSADIYRLIHEFAARGKYVALYCTEAREVRDVADDVVVLSRGRVMGRIDDVNGIASVVDLAERMARLEAS